jgi:poly-beta-1,6-N-acetyl-D-glucosamine synthase
VKSLTFTTPVVPQAENSSRDYIIVSPVRDEERNLEATIRSVAQQTILPKQWIIVDDGSTDLTAQILARAAATYPWVMAIHRRNRGFREPGSGVIAAFYEGYQQIRVADWQFLVKLDGDLVLPNDYFERCLEEFQKDTQLGIGGGTLYHIERDTQVVDSNPRFHVRGATKIYRRACWAAIGGLLKAPGWDTLDEVKAHMLDWSTRTFPEPRALHLRPTGSADGSWRNAVKNGRANYISGYHPLFMVLKCVKQVFEQPYGVVAAGLIYGFTTGYLKCIAQVNDAELIRYLRHQQIRRLLLRDSIWK